MNYFDSFDVARAPTPQPSDENQPSLNEEVSQVIGQLGRFWGGFKKQSQQALEVARKDLGDVVLQAQKEIGKLTAVEDPQPEASTSTAEAAQETRSAGSDSAAAAEDGTQSTDDIEDGSASSSTTLERSIEDAPANTSSQSLFSRLQSSLPPNLVSTVQSHIPESIKHASENIDITQIGSNLMTELQRVQGITRAQAEEYARKSEVLIREAVKEANEVLKDAVKILPPDSTEGHGDSSGMIWDGSDMWMLPTDQPSSSSSSTGKEKATEPGNQPIDTQRALASRALALLHRLQSDPTIIQHDPGADEGVRELYKTWQEDKIKSKGGINNPEWTERTEKLLKQEATLAELYASLVPSALTAEEFWSRYFFRAHQIKHEEERRKALVQATVTESDEDFSWEDEEDENIPTSQTPAASSTDRKKLSVGSASSDLAVGSLSPSVGSADSFDVVSSTNASVASDLKEPVAAETGSNDEDDDDDDEDEEDEESDWE